MIIHLNMKVLKTLVAKENIFNNKTGLMIVQSLQVFLIMLY